MTAERRLSPGETDCANAIFQQPWWLETLAPGRWGEASVERGGRVIARLPYVVVGRRRPRALTQPPFTPTLGPWVERSSTKMATSVSQEMELLAELEAALPRAQAFLQWFSPTMLNALPFHWAGYRLQVSYTYRIEGLASEETLWNDLRGNIRREIRKARKRVEVREDLGLDRFYAVVADSLTRQGAKPPKSMAWLERLDAACASRGARCMLFARDEADRVHAVAYIVWDRSAAYYLMGGGDAELRTSGASSLLMWEAMMRAREVTDVFDFEGSMIKPVERFFRAFGGRQAPYLRVSRATPHAAAHLVSAWRRLSARRGR
jgi:hypothetical protein